MQWNIADKARPEEQIKQGSFSLKEKEMEEGEWGEEEKSKNSIMETEKRERMGRGKWECDREAVEQIKVKLSAFTYLDERF